MGSFNVACSISNLSINEGDRVKFFILKGEDINISSIEGNLLYSDALMKPVALPISGIYADYGRVEGDDTFSNNIISQYFDLEIDEITDRIIQGTKINNTFYSGMFVLEEVYEKLVKLYLDDNSVYNSYLTKEIAESVGFEKISIEEQYFNVSNYKYLYRKKGFDYELFIGKYGSSLVPINDKQYYTADHRFLSELYRDWEKLTKTSKDTFPIDLEKTVDSNKDFEIVKNKVFELTGVTLNFSKKSIYIYSVMDFVNEYNNISTDKINLDYLKDFFAVDNLIEKAIKEIKELKSLLSEKVKNSSIGLDRLLSISNQLQTFKDWSLFDELYTLDTLKNNELKIEIRNVMAFNSSMVSCNRFYFPAMNGEQFGNTLASKALLETSLEIIEKRLKEENEDFE